MNTAISQPSTIVIADDHPITRIGLQASINSLPTFEIIGQAEDGQEAMKLIELLLPDVAVLDIDMPSMSGIEIFQKIVQFKLNTKVIFFTNHIDNQSFNEAVILGANGILLKESTAEEIYHCLQTVMANEVYISKACYKFINASSKQNEQNPSVPSTLKNLSITEKAILKLIAKKKTTEEIASLLHNSYKTIEKHRYNICKKLKIEGHNSLLSYALEHKHWIEKH